MERKKYMLLITGLRKKLKLERPFHVLNLVTQFITETLQIKVPSMYPPDIYLVINFSQGIPIEEAYRIQDQTMKRPSPIRVRFASIVDRNSVLRAGRQIKGRVKVVEDMTEKMRKKRKQLAFFARKEARKTK